MAITRDLGTFVATAYGPPWTGMQGSGVTADGTDLRPAKHLYVIAVDPAYIKLGSRVTINPNPYGLPTVFRAADTGGAIKGRRIDIYMWEGRRAQNAWGRRNVRVTLIEDAFAGSPSGADAGAIPGLPAADIQDNGAHATGESNTDYSPLVRATAKRARSSAGYVARMASLVAGITSPTIDLTLPPEPTVTGSHHPSGLVMYRGVRMAAWIAQVAHWADGHGYNGGYLSGYRSNADQARICQQKCGNPNGCPGTCAKPGTSNHHGIDYPAGALDVTDPDSFERVLRRYPGGPPLRRSLPNDRNHFSHAGN